MTLQLGTIEQVRVLRQTDIGYMVGTEEEEVLLHNNEVAGEIEVDDEIDVFIYSDNQNRITATMKTPAITTEDFGWVSVVSVMKNLGVFVNIGIAKDILVPEDELPGFYGVWPEEGDELYCILKATRNDRLIAKLARQEDMEELAVDATESMFNKNVAGRVYRSLRVGSFILTDEHFLGFVHESERREEPRLGQRVEGRIIAVKEDGTINVSLLPRKQEGMEEDAERIYEYMEGRGGAMPFGDKTGAEDIKERFNMSKGAFKRALGKLMKDGKVYQEEGWTYFVREEKASE
ncbi:CvfB family protein [Ectobacillus ponti]|uniref:S1-like domain-containing RNA-binding protein n=1 Tax=Ectobacillus ponti TaxID=2961894 RepID=A0AA42BP10_9BACI|nr:S1-like domain-containing RNA-binding protein [Ectobacillus ponti]MCP8968277.1 S1-like domain-containing RNA-binding protein [Ectobacillus ponti]